MTTSTITGALQRVEKEKQAIRRELRAFETFQQEVRELPITPRSSRDRSKMYTSLEKIFACYRETILDASGPTDEDLDASIREEFSSNLWVRLRKSDHLDGRLKRRLLDQVERAIQQRTCLITILEKEQRSLEAIESELSEIDQVLEQLPTCTATTCRMDVVIDTWETLNNLEDRTETLVETRQQFLAEIREYMAGPVTPADYLYYTYPVLKSIAERLVRIEEKRHRPVSAIRPESPTDLPNEDASNETGAQFSEDSKSTKIEPLS